MADWVWAGNWDSVIDEKTAARAVPSETRSEPKEDDWVRPACTTCAVVLTLTVAAACIGFLGAAAYVLVERSLQVWTVSLTGF
jgi:hypothetical protein